ncbi:MAG: DUF4920 domain-containing protein [Chloroflexota bacterium]
MTLAVLWLAAAPAADAKVALYGKPLAGLKATPVATILASPKDGDVVRVEGKADAVCQAMGCFMTVKQGEASIHVTFEEAGFTVPKDSGGKQAVVEGKVRVKQPDPAALEHKKAEGAGASAASKVSIEAYGVEMRSAPSR